MDYPRYDPASALTWQLDTELQALGTLLHDLPADGAMTLDGLDDWCAGFLQAVDLDPAAWGETFGDPALAPLLQLGGVDGVPPPQAADDLDDPAVCDRLSRSVPDAVLGLRARLAATEATAP